MPASTQRYLRRTKCRLEVLTLGIAVVEAEIEHRTQGSRTVGGECSRIEIDFPHQVGIDDAHGTSRSSLRGEMVDVGNLDAIHEIAVLRRTSTSHYQVIPITDGREGDTREGAYHPRDVPVGTRYLLDVLHTDDEEAHGAFRSPSHGRRTDNDFAQHLCVFFQLHLDERRACRHHVFGSQLLLVSDA